MQAAQQAQQTPAVPPLNTEPNAEPEPPRRRRRSPRAKKTEVEAAPLIAPVVPEPVEQPHVNGSIAVPAELPEPAVSESDAIAYHALRAAPVKHRSRRARLRERALAYTQQPTETVEPAIEQPTFVEPALLEEDPLPMAFAAVEAPAPSLPYRMETIAESPVVEVAVPEPETPAPPVEIVAEAIVESAPIAEPAQNVVVAEPETEEPESEFIPECPACGDAHSRLLFQGTDRLYRTTDKVFQIVECKACRLIRLEPRPTKTELAAYYPERYWFSPNGGLGRLEEAYRRFVLRDHLAFVKQALANSDGNGYLLDVGCGNGLLLSLLPHQKILGFDLSLKALSIAWKQNGVPGACADLGDVPLRKGSCSVVTMFHVVEHLSDPIRYLEAARELLTARGRLVVQVPNASCWQFMLFGQNWNGIDVPRHLFNYRQRDIEALLNYCGFEVTRRKHFSLRDNPAGMASSLAPGLDPMARRVRRLNENFVVKALKDLAYFGLVVAAIPFTGIEAACNCGSSIMLEARKKV